MAIGLTLSPTLNDGSPSGAGGATPGTGSRRRHLLGAYVEAAGPFTIPTISKGGQAARTHSANGYLAYEDIGTTTVNPIVVYDWVEAAIAAMSGTGIVVDTGSFPAETGFFECTIQDCSETDLTYGQGTNGGTSALNAGTPNPPSCALAFALANLSTAGIRVSSTSAASFTEEFDANTGGGALGAYFSRFANYISAQLNLTLSGTTTRGQIIVLGFNEDLGVAAGHPAARRPGKYRPTEIGRRGGRVF